MKSYKYVCLQCETKITSLNLGQIKQHYTRKSKFSFNNSTLKTLAKLLETYRKHCSEILTTDNCNIMHMGLFISRRDTHALTMTKIQ